MSKLTRLSSGMRHLPPEQRITVAHDPEIYFHSAGAAANADGSLVCVYRRSDEHLASEVAVCASYSQDGGKSWHGHRELTRLTFAHDKACWVAPQLGWTRDGRLLVIIDRGEKLSAEDWPMLTDWQKPDRGMSNWLMESADGGKTWTAPRKIDNVGGEPSYIVELSNGSLLYTRTDSHPTRAKKNPEMPWGHNYYRNTAVFSDDRGKTWGARTAIVADDPFHSDAEVGVVEYAPGKLLGITRTGCQWFGGAPSRFVLSDDYGKNWGKPTLAPFYGHRTCVRQLASGKLLVTFRNHFGTPGTCAFLFDPAELPRLGFEPGSRIWDESRCRLEDRAMVLDTAEGSASSVEFSLFPIEDDDSAIEVEAELAVPEADWHTCHISAGVEVCFKPRRVCFAHRPAEGFELDASAFHRYRIVYRDQHASIYIDGELRLRTPVAGIFVRPVRFGNRPGGPRKPGTLHEGTTIDPATATGNARLRLHPNDGGYHSNTGRSLWRSISASVMNRRDHSIDWKWSAASGKFPDQFRRDRIVMLERNASFSASNNGYSGWCQTPDGRIIVADYTCGEEGHEKPLLRAYLLDEKDLTP